MEPTQLSQPPDNADPKSNPKIQEFKNFLVELDKLRDVLTDAEAKLVSVSRKCVQYFEDYHLSCDLHLMLADGLKSINTGVDDVEEKFHAKYDVETGLEREVPVEARKEDDDAVFKLLLSPETAMKSELSDEHNDEPAENFETPAEETTSHQFPSTSSSIPADVYEPQSPQQDEDESCSDWDPDDEVPPPNYQQEENYPAEENSASHPPHPPVPPIKISNLLKRRASQSLQRKIKKSQKSRDEDYSPPRHFVRSSSEPPTFPATRTPTPPPPKRKRGRPKSLFPKQTIPYRGPVPVPGAPGKRGRGRPRKIIPLSQHQPIISHPPVNSPPTNKRGRGRPRKIPLPVEEQEQIIIHPPMEEPGPPPTKRGRGRPRKIIPLPSSPPEQIICYPDISPLPKKRGRPRKHPLPPPPKFLKTSRSPSPTFSSSPPPSPPPPPQKKRGRPRKLITPSSPPISKSPVTCPICEKVLAYNGLPLHTQRCHTVQALTFNCTFCPRAFPTKGQLKNHVKIHSDVKNFICEVCGWSFHLNSNLQQHMRKHRDERPFKCTHCDATFKYSQSCKLHIVAIHSDKSNQCTACGKMFSTLTKLKSHDQSVHQSIRKFTCALCGKGFKRGHHLKYHEKTHTNPTAKPRGYNRVKKDEVEVNMMGHQEGVREQYAFVANQE